MKRYFLVAMISALTCTGGAQAGGAFAPEVKGSLSVADSTPITNGYRVVDNPFLSAKAKTTGQPVDVLEYFSYSCQHCAALSPKLAEWEAQQGARVRVQRIPVTFGRAAMANLGRLYLALSDMGVMTKDLDQAIFKAVHQDHINLSDPSAMQTWLATQQVDAAKFEEAYKAKSIDERLRLAEAAVRNLRINGVPALLVGGRYLVAPDAPEKLLETAGKLVANVRGGR